MFLRDNSCSYHTCCRARNTSPCRVPSCTKEILRRKAPPESIPAPPVDEVLAEHDHIDQGIEQGREWRRVTYKIVISFCLLFPAYLFAGDMQQIIRG